jgi:Family of unknown function (DUF6194)
MMELQAILDHIAQRFPRALCVASEGAYSLYTDPELKHPFATIETSYRHDTASDLNREGVYRLNVRVSKRTVEVLFPDDDAAYDYAALDTLLPHPVYRKTDWVCVLNPSKATFEKVKPLLAEAHVNSFKRYADDGE